MDLQSEAYVGTPMLDTILETYTHLRQFTDQNIERGSDNTIRNKTAFTECLQKGPVPVVSVYT